MRTLVMAAERKSPPRGKPISVDVNGKQISLFNIDSRYYAIGEESVKSYKAEVSGEDVKIEVQTGMLKAPYERYPRYSQRPFPPYRFIQGKNPHPLEDPQGHSYGQPSEDPKILNPDKWYENETYLFGADLYNYAFFWESHESFESLWKRQQKNDPARHLLQGLIMISGAFLKWHAKNQQGLESLYAGGIGHLQEVLDDNTEFMGLNLMDHIAKLSNHFTEVIARPDKWPDPLLHYPFIVLAPTLKNKNRTIVRF